MKKFFSAILLMTMMVFSVGTFVSCNDLVEEVQGIQGQVDGQQAAIKALNDEIAVLESALATAQSTADAAKKAADDAAAAAAQAKADAIADAKAQVEALKSAYEGKIAEIEATLAGKVGQEEIDAAVKAATDGVNAALEVINTKLATIEATIKDLQDKKADKAELDAEVAKLLEADTKINTQLAALENYIKNLEVGGSANASQIDSIRTELASAAAEIEALWADLKDENTGLFALVAGNASAISAMQEDFQAALDELYADIYGEGPNSLFTMVGQHAGLIQDLDERMTAAEEAILANNQALSIAIKIANQIQSVVYVPTSDNIPSMSYYLGATTLTTKKYESPLMIMATYEVSPKALVETLEDANVGFATVATKVAGAEYFGAKIIDRDATTGRMIVVGYITKGSEAYKVLTGANTENGVAFNLNVSVSAPFNVEDEDGLQASIDAGTFVVSTYTKATVAGEAKNLAKNVKVGFTYNQKVAYNTNYAQEYEVPYSPVGESSSRVLFDSFKGLYVNFEGTYLPLDKASEVLGFDLVPSYGEFKATYNAADNNWDGKKESPIVVSGENFGTVATLVGPTADYQKEADAIGQNVVVNVEGVKLNDTAVDVTIQSTYKVGYKKADITLTSADFVWSYQYGAELNGDYGDTVNDFPLLKSAAELDVTSGTADISALYVGDPQEGGTQFSPNNVIEFKSTAKDSKGNEYDATIQVVSLSKDNVRIVGGNVPFAPGEELTYKFNAILYDKARVQYTLGFEFTTTPMPANKEIVLDPVAVDFKYNYDMVAPVAPFDAILAVDAAYYPEAAAGLASYEALSDAFVAGTGALTVYDPNTPASDQNNFGFDVNNYKTYDYWSTNLTAVYDVSSVTIKDAVIGDKFVFIYEYTVFDVVYTIVVPAEVVKATGYALEVNPLLVNSNNVVNLTKGTVKYPTVPTGSAYVTPGTNYELEVIDLRDYVMVTGEDKNDKDFNELALTYTVNNYYKVGNNEYFGDTFATVQSPSTNTLTGTVDDIVNQLSWNLNNQYGQYNNTISVTIDLVANTNTTDMYDPKKRILYGSQTLTLVVPELLEATAIKPVYDSKKASNCKGAYSIMEANTSTGALEWTPVNAVKGLKVTATDTKKTALYNPYAANLNELWMDYNSSQKVTIADGEEVFAVYNQTTAKVVTKKDGSADATAKFQNSGKAVPADYYHVDPADGTVSLTVNSGEITDNIIVTVPVVFKHDYCASEHKVNVEVLFVK